jgi:hypothetical protein
MNRKYIIYVSSIALLTAGLIFISWRRRAATVASSFMDTMEIGNNAGFSDKAFQQMLSDIGWRGGEAWCMYFAKAVYLEAFPKKADRINQVLTGSTQGSFAKAKENPDLFKVITEGPPQRGDIIIWQSTTDPSLGHAGIAYKKDSGDKWWTVEGNSGFGGTREGQGVTKGHRTLVPGTTEGTLKLRGFLRLKNDLF